MLTLVRAALWRLFRPRRTIKPTRDGWWCLLVAVGLGVAAINTGNNLLYLLVSALLALIVVSGILSEQSMRGLRLTGIAPDEIYAGQPALARGRARQPQGLVHLVLGHGGAARPRGALAVLLAFHLRAPDRGGARAPRDLGGDAAAAGPPSPDRRAPHHALPLRPLREGGATRLHRRRGRVPGDTPGLGRGASPARRERRGSARRRGRGNDLYNLRAYRSGDDPRFIHWRSSAKAEGLLVRELEADTSPNTRLVLVGRGRRGTEALERGLSEASSLAVALVRAGAGVELAGAGCAVPLGHGRAHLRRMLTELALYDAGGPRAAPAALAGPAALRGTRPLREIRIALA